MRAIRARYDPFLQTRHRLEQVQIWKAQCKGIAFPRVSEEEEPSLWPALPLFGAKGGQHLWDKIRLYFQLARFPQRVSVPWKLTHLWVVVVWGLDR